MLLAYIVWQRNGCKASTLACGTHPHHDVPDACLTQLLLVLLPLLLPRCRLLLIRLRQLQQVGGVHCCNLCCEGLVKLSQSRAVKQPPAVQQHGDGKRQLGQSLKSQSLYVISSKASSS
jgi:hypothetical protein